MEDDKGLYDPSKTGFYDFASDPNTATQFGEQREGLFDRYSGIADEGLISPDVMQTLFSNFQQLQAPGVAANRARVSADVSQRLGSRSGASAKAQFNLVDVPAHIAESEFASQMFQFNQGTKQSGIAGLERLNTRDMAALQGLFSQYLELLNAREGRASNERIAEGQDSGGGLDDILGGIAPILPFIPGLGPAAGGAAAIAAQ